MQKYPPPIMPLCTLFINPGYAERNLITPLYALFKGPAVPKEHQLCTSHFRLFLESPQLCGNNGEHNNGYKLPFPQCVDFQVQRIRGFEREGVQPNTAQ